MSQRTSKRIRKPSSKYNSFSQSTLVRRKSKPVGDACKVCGDTCTGSAESICCEKCNFWHHRICIRMDSLVSRSFSETDSSWFCESCNEVQTKHVSNDVSDSVPLKETMADTSYKNNWEINLNQLTPLITSNPKSGSISQTGVEVSKDFETERFYGSLNAMLIDKFQ